MMVTKISYFSNILCQSKEFDPRLSFFTLTQDIAKITYFGHHHEFHIGFYFGYNKTIS